LDDDTLEEKTDTWGQYFDEVEEPLNVLRGALGLKAKARRK